MAQVHPIVALALAGCIPSSEISKHKKKIAQGTNAGFVIQAEVTGRLTRGKNTKADPTANVLNEATVAELIRRLGITREAFESMLLEIATEALVEGVAIRDKLVDDCPELLAVVHTVKQNVIKQLPQQTRTGAIKVIADVQLPHFAVD